MTELVLMGLKTSVVALILAIGLSATFADLAYLWRRPAHLARALFAMYVAVPAAGFLVLRALELPPALEIAVLVLAVSAGAPLLPRKLLKIGHGAYMLSLVATSTAVAVVAVPLWLRLLEPIYGIEFALSSGDVAAAIAVAFVLPLAVGMAVRWRLPGIAARLSEPILTLAGLTLLVSALALLALHGGLLLALGWPTLIAFPAMTAAALAIGHVLGGPEPEDRIALAIACATRHVGIAVLVASSVPGARAAVLVVAYLLSAAIVSIPYLRLARRRAGREPA